MLGKQVLIDQEVSEATLVETHEGTMLAFWPPLDLPLVFRFEDLGLAQLWLRHIFGFFDDSWDVDLLLLFLDWLWFILCHHLHFVKDDDLGLCHFLFLVDSVSSSCGELARCPNLDERVLRVDISTFTPYARIDVLTDKAFVENANNWDSLAEVARDTFVNNLRLLTQVTSRSSLLFSCCNRLELCKLFAHDLLDGLGSLLTDHISKIFEGCG